MNITSIKGVGPKLYNNLKFNNLNTIYDIYTCVPKTYENYYLDNYYTVKDGKKVNLIVRILKIEVLFSNPPRVKLSLLLDNKYYLNGFFFDKKYLLKILNENDLVFINGKYNQKYNSVTIDKLYKNINQPTIKPEYKLKNINDYSFSKIVKEVYSKNIEIIETLPNIILFKYKLVNRKDAIYNLHFPSNIDMLNKSIYRFKFEEALRIQLNLLKEHKVYQKEKFQYDIKMVKEFIKNIGYTLTNDQQKVVNEIYKNFNSNISKKYLLMGDVGSGKTICVGLAMFGAITAGKQCVMMAPTEILAIQHYNYFLNLFQNYNLNICLLTSKTKNKDRIIQDINDNKYNIICGTQSLVSSKIKNNNIGLVVIDEQHKFGLSSRNKLIEKLNNNGDSIMLSATPIPRSLCVSFFGDVSLLEIKEKPLGRKKINSKLMLNDNFDELIPIIEKTIEINQKVFIVVPAITSDKKINVNSVYLKLENIFKDKLFLLHGNQSKKEQDIVTEKFYNEKSGILLSTSIIEVGIDIKEATLMIVLDAKYFGLAQLHQLRGRVGRNNLESYFYLLNDNLEDERLKKLVNIDDGFELSKYDLTNRGPSDFLSKNQTGLLKTTYLDFFTDYDILKLARNAANYILKEYKNFNSNEKYWIKDFINNKTTNIVSRKEIK